MGWNGLERVGQSHVGTHTAGMAHNAARKRASEDACHPSPHRKQVPAGREPGAQPAQGHRRHQRQREPQAAGARPGAHGLRRRGLHGLGCCCLGHAPAAGVLCCCCLLGCLLGCCQVLALRHRRRQVRPYCQHDGCRLQGLQELRSWCSIGMLAGWAALGSHKHHGCSSPGWARAAAQPIAPGRRTSDHGVLAVEWEGNCRSVGGGEDLRSACQVARSTRRTMGSRVVPNPSCIRPIITCRP